MLKYYYNNQDLLSQPTPTYSVNVQNKSYKISADFGRHCGGNDNHISLLAERGVECGAVPPKLRLIYV